MKSTALAFLFAAQLVGVSLAQESPKIPLVQGLVVVTALNDPKGDYESIKTITAVADSGVELSYTADNSSGSHKISRTVSRVDLLSADAYARFFEDDGPVHLPGSTAIGTSRRVLIELKADRPVSFRTYVSDGMGSAIVHGTLKRVGTSTFPLPVILNDERTLLPTIQVRGMLQAQDGATHNAEFFFLDDPDNPLCLRYVIENTSAPVLNVIKISTPSTAQRIERALATSGRATLYGIYFDFASARIKDESDPVLKQIADVMAANAAWSFRVEGHTDNIGGDSYNLDLSMRRAAAVRDSLVQRFNISPSRITTAGFGSSRPKETNDTLEGRAQNRRVELVRD